MSFKLTGLELDTDRIFRVEYTSPSGAKIKDAQGNPAYIDVVSLDSRRAESAARTSQEARLAGAQPTVEMFLADRVEELVAVTIGWYLLKLDGTPILDDDNQPVKCNPENARTLYKSNAASFITEQVRTAAGARKNFMPAPQNS